MKKFYTLLFIAFLTVGTVFAQTTEDFNNFTGTATYADGAFVGNGTIAYTYGHSRNVGIGTADDYSINGAGIMLRRASDSYFEATFPLGLSSFSFQYRKAFTGGAIRQLEILVNGAVNSTTAEFGEGSGADATAYTYNLTINQNGPVVVRIKLTGDATTNRQVTLDNIVWTPFNLSVNKNSIEGLKVYPNPVTNGTFYINTNADSTKDVVVYDVLGKQVIKTSTTNAVNVSNLKGGVYIVKITEDGNTATRKLVIK